MKLWLYLTALSLSIWAACGLANPQALALDYTPGDAIARAPQNHTPPAILQQSLANSTYLALSLEEAIFLALRYSPDVENAELQRVVDKYNLALSYYNFDVQYKISGSTLTTINQSEPRTSSSTIAPQATIKTPLGTSITLAQDNNYNTGEGQTGAWQPTVSLSLEQPLISGFGTEYNLISLANAQDSEIINRMTMRDTIANAISTVINSYLQLIQNNNDLQTNIASYEADKITVEIDKALINAGRKAATDVATAEAQVASDQLSILTQKNTISNSMQTLVNNIGLKPGTKIQVPADVEVIFTPIPDLKESIELALKNNTTYQNSLMRLKSLERQLYQDQQDALPELDLVATTRYGNNDGSQSSTLGNLGETTTLNNSIGLNLNIPIDNFNDKALIQQDLVAIQQQKIQIRQQRESIEITIINDINNLTSGMETVKQSLVAVKLQEQAQENLVAKGKFGLASTIDITNGQQLLNTARQQVIQNKIRYLQNLTQFYMDLGVLLEKWNIGLRY